jgi:hypothetical protein
MSGRRTLRLLRRSGSAASVLAAALPALASKPEFGPNVLILDPSMPSQAMQKQIDPVYATQQHNEFAPQRNALLFLPGSYSVDVPVGFYTEDGAGSNPIPPSRDPHFSRSGRARNGTPGNYPHSFRPCAHSEPAYGSGTECSSNELQVKASDALPGLVRAPQIPHRRPRPPKSRFAMPPLVDLAQRAGKRRKVSCAQGLYSCGVSAIKRRLRAPTARRCCVRRPIEPQSQMVHL